MHACNMENTLSYISVKKHVWNIFSLFPVSRVDEH